MLIKNSERKPLLVFAHRKEGSAFFNHLSFQKITSGQLRLYEHKGFFLLISGNGLEAAYYNVKYTLEKKAVTHVINLGLAASLSIQKAELAQIYPLKLIYRTTAGQIDLENILNTDNTSGLACLSSENPVFSKEDIPQGPVELIDQEVWGIVKAAREKEIPVYSYKIVSDYPGIHSKEDIMSRVAPFSQQLYDFYKHIKF